MERPRRVRGYTADQVRTARTFLFVPGNRPERFVKAAHSGADVVVIDLEDAVESGDKQFARGQAAQWLSGGQPAMVRINPVGTAWHDQDLTLVTELGVPVMLAKTERATDVNNIADRTNDPVIVPLIETAAGVASAWAINAAAGVQRCAFGTIDLAAELGIDPQDREALLTSRSTLVMTAANAGAAPPIDGVTTALGDSQSVTDDFTYAKRLGMAAKLCIHPGQIAPIHAAAAPTENETRWAQKIIDAFTHGASATAVDGHMVDAPVLARARRILRLAQSHA